MILSPDCVLDILFFLSFYGFNGRAVEEGRSFARVGEAQFDESISLTDDVTHPMAAGIDSLNVAAATAVACYVTARR